MLLSFHGHGHTYLVSSSSVPELCSCPTAGNRCCRTLLPLDGDRVSNLNLVSITVYFYYYFFNLSSFKFIVLKWHILLLRSITHCILPPPPLSPFLSLSLSLQPHWRLRLQADLPALCNALLCLLCGFIWEWTWHSGPDPGQPCHYVNVSRQMDGWILKWHRPLVAENNLCNSNIKILH